ncbi:MAG TPA: efflux RND transporter permease subunit [Jatrophihabitantaceae bacterium]
MIRGLVALSLKFRVLVVGVAVLALGLGLTQLHKASVEVLPEFAPPQVQVQAEALGLSAAEVEQLITVPLEQDLLNGIPWLDQIRSESVPGLSSIDLVFKRGTNILTARQFVSEHLAQAHALPQVGTPPVMVQPVSSLSRVMMVGLSAKELSLLDVSILARWKIRPRLLGLPGVANVAIWGQRDRQLQVQVDPARLRDYGVSLNQVIDTAGNALWVSPLTFVEASTPGTGGFVDTSTQRFAIQHVLPITTPAELASVSVEDTQGRTLRLGQVADVVEDHQPLVGDAVLGDGPGLMLVIEKFPGANTRAVTHEVEHALEEMRPGLSGIRIDTSVYRPATFLQTALHNLTRWAIAGVLLVVALLAGFTLSWRAALVTLVSASVSLVTAAYVLYASGHSFNLMVLAGLAIALAIVIDDAVVGVDAIRQRLREPNATEEPRSTRRLIADASATVRGPLVYATVVVLLAALPALALGGLPGALASPLVWTYLLAVAISLVVALTVTPALSLLLLGEEPVRARGLAPLLARGYDRLIARHVSRPARAYVAVGVIALAALAVLPQLTSRATLPRLQDRDLLVRWQAAPGTSLVEMSRITAAATHELQGLPGVTDVGSHVGRAILSDQSVNVNAAEIWVSVAGSADYGKTVSAIDTVVHGYPGLRGDVRTYEQAQLNGADTGTNSDVVVRVYGNSLAGLRQTADRVRGVLSTVKGIARPAVEAQPEEPTVQIQVDLAKAQKYGIKPGDVRRASATFFAGLPVGSLYEEQKIFDVVVWGTPAVRRTPADIGGLLLDLPGGGHVRLADVADVRVGPYPTVIRHDNVSRSIDVAASVHGRSLAAVVHEVRSRVAAMSMPLEFHAEVHSDSLRHQGQLWRVGLATIAAAVGIYLVLQAAFGSWLLATLIFLVLPLSVVGGVLTAGLVGGVRTLGALMGLLAIFGLAARNVVLLVRSFAREEPADTELVNRVTRERVGPLLLSVLATAAAVLPLLFLGRVAGTEALFPFAVVVLGGLVTTTLLVVLVVPALYLRFASGLRLRGRPPGPSIPEGGQ